MENDLSILGQITGVFSKIADWIASAVTSITPMFYTAEAGLTFLGTLAVTGLAFSVVFLIMGIIQNFLITFVGQLNGDVNAESALIAGNSRLETISSQA